MLRVVTIVSIVLMTLGCRDNEMRSSSMQALEQADKYELLSINPIKPRGDEPAGAFHGYHILGQTTITDPATQKQLNAAFEKGVREHHGNPAACIFMPRHGIRLTKADLVTDFVICFQCGDVQVFKGDQLDHSFFVSGSPQPTFDRVLKQHNLPLATQ